MTGHGEADAARGEVDGEARVGLRAGVVEHASSCRGGDQRMSSGQQLGGHLPGGRDGSRVEVMDKKLMVGSETKALSIEQHHFETWSSAFGDKTRKGRSDVKGKSRDVPRRDRRTAGS